MDLMLVKSHQKLCLIFQTGFNVMIRILYSKDIDTGFYSSQELFCKHTFLIVNILPKEKMYIINRINGYTVGLGRAKDVVALKKKAKEHCRDLGVVFGDEVRNKL